MTLYYYDSETDTTVPVSVEKAQIEDEKELEFIYDDTVRKAWDAKQEEWYFSVIDVIQVLTGSENPKNYWNMLKSRLKCEGSETYTNCVRLKMKAADGKMRKTDCATTEQLLRIIQSIPSPKAEPFKQWLAQVGAERLDEMTDEWKRAGISTTELSRNMNPHGYDETEKVTVSGGNVAANARKELEGLLGRSIISSLNATSPIQLDDTKKA